MKKLRLEVDQLTVQSFTTAAKPAQRGTVDAFANTSVQQCAYPTPSCGETETYGEATCFCLYPRSGPVICCQTDAWCGGGSSPC